MREESGERTLEPRRPGSLAKQLLRVRNGPGPALTSARLARWAKQPNITTLVQMGLVVPWARQPNIPIADQWGPCRDGRD